MELNQEQKELFEAMMETDGMECPEPWWEDAEALVKAGLASLSSARGPEKNWKRLTPLRLAYDHT